MPVTFAVPGQSAVTVEPLPGTLQYGGGHDDRGGRGLPLHRVGTARQGSLHCLVRDTGAQSLASLLALRSGLGEGAATVTGDVPTAAGALLDVIIQGDAVQVALLSWRGTLPA
jgi:hypothetical protein